MLPKIYIIKSNKPNIGYEIARYYSKKIFAMTHFEVKRDQNNKPVINENIHFNISHSDEFVIVGIYDKPIGVDIEKMIDRNFIKIARKYFSLKEFNEIENSANLKDSFYKLWTKKESYLKMTGQGIANNLTKEHYENAKFYEYDLKNYKINICIGR